MLRRRLQARLWRPDPTPRPLRQPQHPWRRQRSQPLRTARQPPAAALVASPPCARRAASARRRTRRACSAVSAIVGIRTATNDPNGGRSSQLLLHLLVAVLQLINPPPQATSLLLYRIEILRKLHQALVRYDALNPRNASVEIVQLDLNRILLRWSRGASRQHRGNRNSNRERQQLAHGDVLSLRLGLHGSSLAAGAEVHDLDAAVLRPRALVVTDRPPDARRHSSQSRSALPSHPAASEPGGPTEHGARRGRCCIRVSRDHRCCLRGEPECSHDWRDTSHAQPRHHCLRP